MEVKFHPAFFKDLEKINKRELDSVAKQIEKIKQNPTRFKHLRGHENCYSLRTGNLRIVYWIRGSTLWFLVVERRKKVYTIYFKRLYAIKQKL